jgi:beta-N-acetylhexosaminidase
MLIIPADIDAAYNGLLQAVRRGEIPREQIDASVLKILRAKASVGLHKARLVDMAALPQIVGSPENKAAAQQVADAAITLVRDNHNILPLTASPRGTKSASNPYTRIVETRNRLVAVLFVDDMHSENGRELERLLRMRVPDVNIIYVDANNAEFESAAILATVEQAERVLAGVYVSPVAGRLKNPVSLAGAQGALIESILQKAGQRTAVVAFGNPYIAVDFPTVQTYMCTFSTEPVSETSAVKALFGEIAVRGRLPVGIPGIAQRGDGLERPRTTAPVQDAQNRRVPANSEGGPHAAKLKAPVAR